MSTLRQVLDALITAGVVAEATDDGRLRLRALFESRPIEADVRDLCREHKRMLMDYLRFARDADRLLLDSSTRIGAAWSEACGTLECDRAWDDHEAVIHDAYWSMDLERLQHAVEKRERYALASLEEQRRRHARGLNR
ncbi:MAG: hypothetical protein JXA87_00375 [Thermoleophilia bacterium]|nr:hypothetical protein [Thermoleophilia bacterium]